MIECNHNCLEYPYPDVPEECLEAELTWDEYRELDAIDKDIINPKTAKQKVIAAQQQAWREANKDKITAWNSAWRSRNKDKISAYWEKWYEQNKGRCKAMNRARYKNNADRIRAQIQLRRTKNKAELGHAQKCIAQARAARGMSQAALGKRIGVNQSTVSYWECGAAPANWDKLCAVLPELEAYRP